MIRITFSEVRRRLIASMLDVGRPPGVVGQCLALPAGQVLVATQDVRELSSWLDRCHAYFGLGFPDALLDMRRKLLGDLGDLEGHPALWGHGVLGYVNKPPLGVWGLEGATYPSHLFSAHPEGTEGFLVPTYDKVEGASYTYWVFTPTSHGPPRPATTWFRSDFARRGRSSDERSADGAKARVAKELRAQLGEASEAN